TNGGGEVCGDLWEAGTGYTGGDQVSWAGKVWEAKWWTRNDDPTKSGQWGVWKEVGAANCSTN
ncbi:hypothetical protein AKJ18_36760, partial [Vibrio xuii]